MVGFLYPRFAPNEEECGDRIHVPTEAAMINIGKQIQYWRDGATEDWEIARDLVSKGKIRHGLF